MWSLWVIPPFCVSRSVGETDLFRPMGGRCLGLAPNFWPFARALRMGGTAPVPRPSVPVSPWKLRKRSEFPLNPAHGRMTNRYLTFH